MKKINLFILCVISFFLSGCTATYTLNIDEEMSDELNIYMSDSEYKKFNSDPNNYLIMQYANQDGGYDTYNGEKIDGLEYYDMQKDDTKKNVTFTSEIDNDKFNEMTLIKYTFRNYTIKATDDELYIKTYKGFDFIYDQLSSVKIILVSPYKVLYSNADSVNENKLIWNITKTNKENAYIEVNYATDMSFDEEINTADENNSNTIPYEDNYGEEENQEQDNITNPDSVNQEDIQENNIFGKIIGIIILLTIATGIIIAIIVLKNKHSDLNKI